MGRVSAWADYYSPGPGRQLKNGGADRGRSWRKESPRRLGVGVGGHQVGLEGGVGGVGGGLWPKWRSLGWAGEGGYITHPPPLVPPFGPHPPPLVGREGYCEQ